LLTKINALNFFRKTEMTSFILCRTIQTRQRPTTLHASAATDIRRTSSTQLAHHRTALNSMKHRNPYLLSRSPYLRACTPRVSPPLRPLTHTSWACPSPQLNTLTLARNTPTIAAVIQTSKVWTTVMCSGQTSKTSGTPPRITPPLSVLITPVSVGLLRVQWNLVQVTIVIILIIVTLRQLRLNAEVLLDYITTQTHRWLDSLPRRVCRCLSLQPGRPTILP